MIRLAGQQIAQVSGETVKLDEIGMAPNQKLRSKDEALL